MSLADSIVAQQTKALSMQPERPFWQVDFGCQGCAGVADRANLGSMGQARAAIFEGISLTGTPHWIQPNGGIMGPQSPRRMPP